VKHALVTGAARVIGCHHVEALHEAGWSGTIVVTVPNGKVFAPERVVGHVMHGTLAMLCGSFDAAGPLTVNDARTTRKRRLTMSSLCEVPSYHGADR
jgi:NAD(P)-dependent dehydrogenase (short-subunit alcohol dehydrogenase family)